MAARVVPVTATRATSDKITASGWNAGPVASNTFLTGKPAFADAGNVVTNFPNNTFTAFFQNGTPLLDSDSGFSLSFQTRYTCQVTGWYLLCGAGGWGSNATGQRYVSFRKNGVDIQGASTRYDAVAGGFDMGESLPAVLTRLTITDYVEVYGVQTSGATLGSGIGSTSGPGFTVTWISS